MESGEGDGMNTTTYLLHRPLRAPLPHEDPATSTGPDTDRRGGGPAGEPEARRAGHDWARNVDPGWARPALIALLLCTAIAYIWDLSASGYANSFYAAAVQAGTKSWKAFFFGSLDSSSFITVDKPPASLWVMELSGRIFGFGSWSMLVPQALEGVAAVALLYAAIKRWFGAAAGLLAGALLAITPVAALMFRFNNPDALLVCLLVASAYCLTRALERAGTKWVIAAGTMIGLAFLAKMMQAFLVLPAFALVYLVAAPTGLRRRLVQLLTGAGTIMVSCGWWVAIVALWPASSRPYVDGSPDNNIFNLIFGYNGLGRIFGSSGPGGGVAGGGGGGGAGGGAGFSGATGPLRLFDNLMGAQASWLLGAALLALTVGLWHSRRAPRTDRTRAALLLWGGWLLVTAAIFSFGQGVIHTYYTVALAPSIAAPIAIAGSVLWRVRETAGARLTATLAVLVTAAWSYVLLDRTPQWEAWLRPLIVMSALLAVAGLLAVPALDRLGRRVSGRVPGRRVPGREAEGRVPGRRVPGREAEGRVPGRRVPGRRAPIAVAIAVFALLACLAGPVAYSAQTIAAAHTGSVPSAGPGSSGVGSFGPGGGAGLRTRAGGSRLGLPGGPGGSSTPRVPSAEAGGVELFGRSGAAHGGGSSTGPSGIPSAPAGASAPGSAAAGGPGGGGEGPGQTTVSSALKRALERDAGRFRWVAAVSGSQAAASLELGTGGEPVMAIGGFNNQGGNLSLAQFKAYVERGEIHYYIASGSGGAVPGGGGLPGGGGITGGAIGGGGARPGGGGLAGSSNFSDGGGPSGGGGLAGGSNLSNGGGLPDGAAGFPGAGPAGGASASSRSAISSWVKASFKAVKIGGETVYDLT